MNRLSAHLTALLFPPKCPVCGTLTSGVTARLCPACAEIFHTELSLPCPVCQNPAAKCTCLPIAFAKERDLFTTVGERCHICTGFYTPHQAERISSRLVFALKQDPADAAAHICASQLAGVLMRQFLLCGEDISKWIFTYAPRSQNARWEAGFDQGERLARLCAQLCGAPFAPMLSRHGGKAQKLLHTEERIENAAATLYLRRRAPISGQKIVLIDDILTTGATLCACARLLRHAGAAEIFCATLLKTPSPDPKKTPWFME